MPVTIAQLSAATSAAEGTQRFGELFDVSQLNWPGGSPVLQHKDGLGQFSDYLVRELARDTVDPLILALNTHGTPPTGSIIDILSFPGLTVRALMYDVSLLAGVAPFKGGLAAGGNVRSRLYEWFRATVPDQSLAWHEFFDGTAAIELQKNDYFGGSSMLQPAFCIRLQKI